jgi:chromosome segregation ATPase
MPQLSIFKNRVIAKQKPIKIINKIGGWTDVKFKLEPANSIDANRQCQLTSNNEIPTIDKVRRLLGDTGSNSNISRHLRAWKAERMKVMLSPKPILPDPLVKTMTDIWEKIRAESQMENERIQAEAQAAVIQAQQAKTEAEQQAKKLHEQQEKAQLKINHLETDLQRVRSELIEKKQEREVFQERAQQSEQRLEDLKKDTEKRVIELEQSHQETVTHLKQQLEKETQFYKQELNDVKTYAENQRHKLIAEIDQLRTAKDKAEKAYLQAASELRNMATLNKSLGKQNKRLEVDAKVLRQQYQDLEKQLVFIQAETTHKDSLLADIKEQLATLHQKFEMAKEQVGELKAINAQLAERDEL